MAFDPTVYESTDDYQKEPALSAADWTARFIIHMKLLAEKCAAPDFLAEMDDYARQTADSYLPDRKQYTSPEADHGQTVPEWIASFAYSMADAMLAEREKP